MAEKKSTKKSGLKVYGVPGNTDYGYGSEGTGEYLPKLQGLEGRQTYDEMRKSDPQVQAVVKALILPVMKAHYYIEPVSNKSKDKEIAEIIEKNLFEGMTMTWNDTLRHICLMPVFGFSILEKLWQVKDDLYQIKKLDPRLPLSITEWKYDDNKKLIGPVQQDTDGKEYQLPIEKLLVFTNDKEGDNWEGTSVLRAAFKPWYIKNKVEKINAIKHDRHGVGIPVAKVPANVKPGSDDWRNTQNALEAIYAHEKSYIIEPVGYEFRLLTTGGDNAGTDALPTIKYCDEGIAKAMLAMFINLGTSQTGSRALGGSFIEVFMDSLQAMGNYICEVFNRFLIREYCYYNWYVDEYPKMQIGTIKNLDTHTISVLKKAGLITYDQVIEASIRKELSLPDMVDEEVPTAEQTVQENEEEMDDLTEEDPGTEVLEQNPPEEKEKALIDKCHIEAPNINIASTISGKIVSNYEEFSRKLADEIKDIINKNALKGSRFLDNNLSFEEKIPDLVTIELKLNEGSRTTREEILKIRDLQAEDIIMQIVAGRKPNKIRVIQKKEMYDTLMKTYKVQIREGRAEVKEELDRQRARGGTMAEGVAPVDYQDFIIYADEKFQIEVEGAGNKLTSELLLMNLAFTRQGISGQALETALLTSWAENISSQTWDKMADGAVNGGWGAGRTIEGNKNKDEIAYAYYSSVLDRNTCAWCTQKDGTKHEVDDEEYATPSPECAGTENRCRCITVYVMKEEE